MVVASSVGCGKEAASQAEQTKVEATQEESVEEFKEEPEKEEASAAETSQIEEETEEDKLYSKYLEALDAFEKGDYDSAESLFTEVGDYKDSTDKLGEIKALKNPLSVYSDAKPNDIIEFGHYEQDNDLYEAEPIEWVVLENDNGKLLLYSKMIIDFLPSNEIYQYGDDYIKMCDYYGGNDGSNFTDVVEEQPVTWAESKVRTWLNSHFYDAAFTDEEKTSIILTNVDTEDTKGTGTGWQWRYSGTGEYTPWVRSIKSEKTYAEEEYSSQNYDIYGGLKSDDYVFLLSYPEFRHYAESDLSEFIPAKNNVPVTEYARNIHDQYHTSQPVYVMGKYDYVKSIDDIMVLTRSVMFPSSNRGDITKMYQGYGHCFGLLFPYRNDHDANWMSLYSFDGIATSTGSFSIPSNNNEPTPYIVTTAGIRPAIWIDTNP